MATPQSSSAQRGSYTSSPDDSTFVRALLKDWSLGMISAPRLQKLAWHAYEDQKALLARLSLSTDHISEDLKKLACLGSSGQHPQHVQEALFNYLGSPCTPTSTPFEIPVVVQKAKADRPAVTSTTPLPILLPHEVFAHWYHTHRDVFNKLYLGECQAAAQRKGFWKELLARNDPRLEQHPMRDRASWDEFAIPLALHGDGVPVLQVGKPGTKSLETFSTMSLWAKGRTLQ
eukprot:5507405-Alexandrium_andersonii.AAC.1